MATEAVNMKELLSPRYRLYRVMQAPGIWRQIYADRIASFGDYRSAVIFPEILLGLNQSTLFTSSNAVSASACSVGVTAIPHNGVCTLKETITKVQSIHEFEEDNQDLETAKNLLFSNASQARYSFDHRTFIHTTPLFTNKNDALKWAMRALEKGVGQIR